VKALATLGRKQALEQEMRGIHRAENDKRSDWHQLNEEPLPDKSYGFNRTLGGSQVQVQVEC
jgi:hypothetical protein